MWLFFYYHYYYTTTISEPNYDSILNHYPKGVAGKITGVKGKEDRGAIYVCILVSRVV